MRWDIKLILKQSKGRSSKKSARSKVQAFIDKLPPFNETYEKWYSTSLALNRQLLPDRLADFIALYEIPKNRKELSYVSYTMRDFLHGVQRVDGSVTISAGYPKFQTQLAILNACVERFTSSLFEIRQLVQADMFDSEIEAGRALLKHGFGRAAGAIAGVVLEKHLRQVCEDHRISISKKHPGISDLNELLKSGAVITIPQWRHITLMGDIRNLCDHSKDKDPSKEQITDLLDGVDKILKMIF
jgi:hypothetical protein